MSLLEVSTAWHRWQFLELPARIYQHHPRWISPLDNGLEAVFDARPVAFFVRLPELNQIFKQVGPQLNLGGKIRLVWENGAMNVGSPAK